MAKKSNKSGAVKRLERFEETINSTRVFAIMVPNPLLPAKPIVNIPGIYDGIGHELRVRTELGKLV